MKGRFLKLRVKRYSYISTYLHPYQSKKENRSTVCNTLLPISLHRTSIYRANSVGNYHFHPQHPNNFTEPSKMVTLTFKARKEKVNVIKIGFEALID